MNVYIYQANIYCEACGEAIKERIAAHGNLPDNPEDEHTMERHIPTSLMCARHGQKVVARYLIHPSNSKTRKHCPINDDMPAAQAILTCGCSRWFGGKQAFICSHLRIAISVDPRDEVQSKWDACN